MPPGAAFRTAGGRTSRSGNGSGDCWVSAGIESRDTGEKRGGGFYSYAVFFAHQLGGKPFSGP